MSLERLRKHLVGFSKLSCLNIVVLAASHGRRMSGCESPKLLTRMKPQKTAKNEILLKLVQSEARNSPKKKRKFYLLLQGWEYPSNFNWTSAAPNMPKWTPKINSQSEKTTQDHQKISPGCQLVRLQEQKYELTPVKNENQKYSLTDCTV